MTTKRNAMFKLVTSAALIMMFMFSVALPAFAAGAPIYAADESHPAEAAIAKVLEMPVGTITPDAEFTFTITPKSVDDSTDPADKAAMPLIGTLVPATANTGTVSVTFDDTYTGAVIGTGAGAYKRAVIETDSLFANVTWPHAGAYVYTITENSGTYTTATGETMTYSAAVYDVAVYVKEKAAAGTYYVYAIGARIVKQDPTGGDPDNEGDKVDPKPGEPDEYGVGDYSEMTFTNTFAKNNGGTDPTDPDDVVLKLSKTVAGDTMDTQRYFTFSVTVTKPAVGAADTTYKAYVVENKGAPAVPTVVTSATENVAALSGTDSYGGYILFTSGTPLTVNLKHGQWLAFIDLPVGTNVTSTESGTPNYTPACALTDVTQIDTAGVITTSGSRTGSKGGSLTFGAGTAVPNDPYVYVGEKASTAAFTNTYATITPTGILVDNLPYIVLIAVALLSLIGFVVIKSRRRKNFNT